MVAVEVRHLKKEKRVSLGTHPSITLKAARDRATEARKLPASGIDVSAERQAVKQSAAQVGTNSFESIAREWINTAHKPKVCEAQHSRTVGHLERDVFPWIGATPVDTLKAPELLKVMRRVEARGAVETAHREL